jgi:hypothetical protein
MGPAGSLFPATALLKSTRARSSTTPPSRSEYFRLRPGIQPDHLELAAMNMAIRGIDFNFGSKNADTLLDDQHPDLRRLRDG